MKQRGSVGACAEKEVDETASKMGMKGDVGIHIPVEAIPKRHKVSLIRAVLP